jgi:predicted transposase/invertase (TIGR01784 family)
MPIRFLRYIMELYESFRNIPNEGMFPAVFPLLLYSGDAKWTAKEEINSLIEKSIPEEYIPKFRYYPIFENQIPKKSLTKIKNAVSAIFYIENSSPRELENEIDILMNIIKGENLPVIRELVNWFNNYLFHLNSNIDKESISLKLETLTEVKAMFATKLKEHDEKILEQGIEQGIEQGLSKGAYNKAIETALNLKKLGISVDIITKATGLTKTEIENLK